MTIDNDILERYRAIPLEGVAEALGYRKDPLDPARYRRADSIISINNGRFFDHKRATGGGGAIDLVIHATGYRFHQALQFLSDLEPVDPLDDGQSGEPRSLQLPLNCPLSWPYVSCFLVEYRALSDDTIEDAHRNGTIYADHKNNAVFLCHDATGQVTGAEIGGTRFTISGKFFKAMASGSRKDAGGFYIRCDENRPETVILTESAIDALSAHRLNIKPARKAGAVLVSTAGVAHRIPLWVEYWNPKHIVCAYDADKAGEKAAERLARTDPRVTRYRPSQDKDWNDMLRRIARPVLPSVRMMKIMQRPLSRSRKRSGLTDRP